MSKAFTKESDDAADEVRPVDELILPPGARNYLTPPGAARLRGEIERLREAPRGDPRQKLDVERRLGALIRRLELAEVIDPLTQPADQVLFGATVTVRAEDGAERSYRIVGIDEADARRGWVSWRSPVARALSGKRVGDAATVVTPHGDDELEVVRIDYRAEG